MCSWIDGAEPQWVDVKHIKRTVALQEWKDAEAKEPEMHDEKSLWTGNTAQPAEWLKTAKHSCFLTGAGVAAPLLPTFKGKNGLWTKFANPMKKQSKLSELSPTKRTRPGSR